MRSWTGAMVSLSGRPAPPGSGSSSVSPWYSTRSRASAIRTTSTYSCVRWSWRANGWPCQPSATCGPLGPRPSRKRPPDRPSSVAAVIAVIAAERAGICITAAPSAIVSVACASQPRTVAASDP